ncbi:MAG TPA: phenylalanine--tRNA ligase beta subunit-related protein [Chloroflexota bacterium]|nr:phenylalanine--tRNA ligase beta subunit-related protein [Chloroflexota bacterium]
MRRLADRIHPEIHELFPGYCWGKVLIERIDNRRGLEEATLLLREVETRVRDDAGLVDLVAHPKIAAWRQAFSRFGARPSKFQSSVEALARRARRGDTLPPINPLVALYNAISLRFLVPVGGDDLDLVSGSLHLRLADGDELFVPLGTKEPDPPEPGEVIYADEVKVLCRRWSWRQGEPTKISAATTNAVLNVHGLPPASHDEVANVTETLAELAQRVCGGEARWYVLDEHTSSTETELSL